MMRRTRFEKSMARTMWMSLVAALAVQGAAAGTLEAQSRPDMEPPGRMVDVGGRVLHLDCRGDGSPTVVFDVGAGGWSIHVRHIQLAVARDGARACAYDRAGLGWSDPASGMRTAGDMADDLHALLETAGESPPYVLVGHSLGGLIVRLFAARHPDEVAGVVLAEAAHEEQWERLPPEAWAAVEAAIGRIEQAADAARSGTIPSAAIEAPGFAEHLPELRETYVAAMVTPKPYEGFVSELRGVEESHRQVAEEAGSLGDTPLAVVSAGDSFAAFAEAGIPVEPANRAWAAMQEALTELSSNSVHLVSPTADHAIHFSDPDVVLRGIRRVLAEVEPDSGDGGAFRPDPEFRVLPDRAPPAIDRLLDRLEGTYAAMDVDAFVDLFAEDFVQLDVNRGVRVEGKEAWREQTRRINGAHRTMGRRHFGRIWSDPWLIVEVEWWGDVRSEALGGSEDGSYRYSGIGLVEIRDGLIRRQVLWGDYATLLDQLGPAVARGDD